MRLPEPLTLPWKMKSLSSARITFERLSGGRRRYSIEHDLLRGVTPEMLVWWFNNMEGVIELEGQTYPRYRVWHPQDHVAVTYVRPARDGRRFGTDAQIKIQEVFGRDPRFVVDSVSTVEFLDETGFAMGAWKLGARGVHMEYHFARVDGGTHYRNSLTAGLEVPIVGAILNRTVIPRVFSDDQGRAWQKHNVEEVGNFEFFLPALFAREASKSV